jgi:hypothetical protein
VHGAPVASRGGGGSWPRAVAELKREKSDTSSVERGFSALGRDSGLTSDDMRLVVCRGVRVTRGEAGEASEAGDTRLLHRLTQRFFPIHTMAPILGPC